MLWFVAGLAYTLWLLNKKPPEERAWLAFWAGVCVGILAVGAIRWLGVIGEVYG